MRSKVRSFDTQCVKWFESLGVPFACTEVKFATPPYKRDLLGFGDYLLMPQGGPPKIVQVTSTANVSTRVRKIKESPHYAPWVLAGGAVEVHGWGDGPEPERIVQL